MLVVITSLVLFVVTFSCSKTDHEVSVCYIMIVIMIKVPGIGRACIPEGPIKA